MGYLNINGLPKWSLQQLLQYMTLKYINVSLKNALVGNGTYHHQSYSIQSFSGSCCGTLLSTLTVPLWLSTCTVPHIA